MNTYQSQIPQQHVRSTFSYQNQAQSDINRQPNNQYSQQYQNVDNPIMRNQNLPPAPQSSRFIGMNSAQNNMNNYNNINKNTSPFLQSSNPPSSASIITQQQINSNGFSMNTPKAAFSNVQQYATTSIQGSPFNRQPTAATTGQQQGVGSSQFATQTFTRNASNSTNGQSSSRQLNQGFSTNQNVVQQYQQPGGMSPYQMQSQQQQQQQNQGFGIQNVNYLGNPIISINNINNQRRIQPAFNQKQRNHSKEDEKVRFSTNTKEDEEFDETEVLSNEQMYSGSFQVAPTHQQPSMFRKVSSQNRNLSEGTGMNMKQSSDVNSSGLLKLRRQKSIYKYNSDMLSDSMDTKSLSFLFNDNIQKLRSDAQLNVQTAESVFAYKQDKRWISKSPHSKIMNKLLKVVSVIEQKYGVAEKEGCVDIFRSSVNSTELKQNLLQRVKTQIKLIKALEQVVNETQNTKAKELLETVKSNLKKKQKLKKLAEEGRSDLDLEGQLKEIHKSQLDALTKLEVIEYKYDFGGFSDSTKREETNAKLNAATPKEHRKITSELLQQRLKDACEQCEATKYVISQVKEKELEKKLKNSVSKSLKGSQEVSQKSQLIVEIPLDQVILDTTFLITQSLPDFQEAWKILIEDEVDTQQILTDVEMGLFNLKQCKLFKQIKFEPIKKVIQKYIYVIFLDLRLPIRKNYEINVQVFDCYLRILQSIQEDLTYYTSMIEKTLKQEHTYFFAFRVTEELNKQHKYIEFLLDYNKSNIENIKSLKKQFGDIVNPMDIMSKYKSTIEIMNHPQINQKEIDSIFETHKNAKEIQIKITEGLQSLELDKISGMCAEFDLPSDHFLQILKDQIEKEMNSTRKGIKFIESYVSKYRYVESEVDESIKKLQNQGMNIQKSWEQVDDGKMKFELEELENFYKQLKETLEEIGGHIYDPQVSCNMSRINFKKAQKIYNSLKIIHKKVLKHVFLQKEIHLIDLKVFQDLVNGLDLTDVKSEDEFKKYCNMIQGIQTMIEIENENQEFKFVFEQNLGFFKLIDFFMKKHSMFKQAYEKAQDLTKMGNEYTIDSLYDQIREICGNDRLLQKSVNAILSFSQEFHKRCTEQINKKAIEQNISQKNQLIDSLAIYKSDLYARIEQFYLQIFEGEQTFEIVGGIENVYKSNKIDFSKFQDQIKTLQRKFKNQPLHFQVLDGYNLEAQQNQLLTKYFIDLNNFLIKSVNASSMQQKINSRQSTPQHQDTDNFIGQIQSLQTFNSESKIEIYLKKRKNINIEIYHRFERLARNFYQFFEYALETNRKLQSFISYFDKSKKQIDLGDKVFVDNLNDCIDLKNNFEKRIEGYVVDMKATKLNSFFLFSKKIIEKVKRAVADSLIGYNFQFLTKLQSLLQNDRYKDCYMNYATAYQEVKHYIIREQKKKQIKDFLDDLHSVYLPKVRMSIANSLTNWENFHQFIPDVYESQMFEEMRFISQKFENHRHKYCEQFFGSIYDIIHLYVQQKHNIREQKDLMNKISDMFIKHNQTYQMNLSRELSDLFQTIIKDDYVLSRNFKN